MLLLAVAVLIGNPFLSAFGGTWACASRSPGAVAVAPSHWTIAQAPKSAWVVMHWTARATNGTAFVGFLGPERGWVYDDFRSDGSLAASTSPGPVSGVWTWTGSFTTRQRFAHGAIQWQRVGSDFHQRFGRSIGASFVTSASTTCRRVKN